MFYNGNCRLLFSLESMYYDAVIVMRMTESQSNVSLPQTLVSHSFAIRKQ